MTIQAPLAHAIQQEVVRGATIGYPDEHSAILRKGKRVNHVLHLIVSLLTGIWIRIWLIFGLTGSQRQIHLSVPINLFENDRELMVVAPTPGVAPEDISVEVTADGALTLRAQQRGAGQERITYLVREWAYGPYERTVELPCAVDASRANLSYGNGVLSVTLPKAKATTPARLVVDRTGHTRGLALGHPGERGGVRQA